ncbi:MAG: phosphoribosylamine--glycine ligase [Coriobacteriia bacterium]|nr:phosphoribosylamine--glycine ligase [Coriobacteriia bacterium]
MNILVIGSGGREHAIVRGLAASPEVEYIYVSPGNGGTALEDKAVNVDLSEFVEEDGLLCADEELANSIELPELAESDQFSEENIPSVELRFALTNNIDLVVVGPEAPLVDGLADELRRAGVAVFGPGADGAMLEGSKQFSKDFMFSYDIPTAAYGVFTKDEREAAVACIEEFAYPANPVVIKADGLAAGKGVTVAGTAQEAIAALDECFDGRFGDAGDSVVVEACLVGDECSMIAFVDGMTVLPLAPSQDHKRVGEGDTGPNTGGMGCYSPVPSITDEQLAEMTEILERTAAALVEEGIEYRGILYAGFMLTEDGPQILEFNVRFGDPETQVLLPRLKSDLAAIMLKTARGELAGTTLDFVDAVGVSVVIASAGYPGEIKTNIPIRGAEQAAFEAEANYPNVALQVYHAGTKVIEDEHGIRELVTSGGRVINVTALAPDFETAIAAAYDGVEYINFDGAFSRQDIAQRAL